MFKDEYNAVCNAGAGKMNLLKKNPAGYFVAALVAGMFISLGSFVAFTLGSVLSAGEAASWTKAAQAFAFSSALSLVVMAGAEAKLWAVCWTGNLIGSLLSVAVFQLTGLPSGDTAAYFGQVAAAKVGLDPVALLARAVLCNILVCLAVWCATKMKTESGKLIMIFWCIFVFMVSGFEHSVANMSVIGVAVANGMVGIGQYCYNVILATVGNMVGAIVFVALPYHIISKEK